MIKKKKGADPHGAIEKHRILKISSVVLFGLKNEIYLRKVLKRD